jgi:YbbR domain-containing protein
MERLRRLLTHNWFEKIFALLFASMLWLIISTETRSEIGIEVPLEFRNIPPQVEITGEATNTVEVRLRGSSNLIKEISSGDVSTTVDLRGMDPGEKTFPLTTANVEAPFGVQVVRVNPSRVRLSLERTISRMVRVTPSVEGSPAAGYEIVKASATPSMVEVEGPESSITMLESVPTAPVNIEGVSSGLQSSVDLDVTDPLVRLQQDARVQVRIEIRRRIQQ